MYTTFIPGQSFASLDIPKSLLFLSSSTTLDLDPAAIRYKVYDALRDLILHGSSWIVHPAFTVELKLLGNLSRHLIVQPSLHSLVYRN